MPAAAQDSAPVARTTVRFVHAVPNASNADIRVDGEVVFQNVGFGQSTEYTTILPGDREISVSPSADGNDPTAQVTTSIDEGSAYVLTILGQVGDVRIKVNEVKLSTLDVGKVRVRLIHASPDAAEIDLAFQGGDDLFNDVTFEEDTKYSEIDAATYNMELQMGRRRQFDNPVRPRDAGRPRLRPGGDRAGRRPEPERYLRSRRTFPHRALKSSA